MLTKLFRYSSLFKRQLSYAKCVENLKNDANVRHRMAPIEQTIVSAVGILNVFSIHSVPQNHINVFYCFGKYNTFKECGLRFGRVFGTGYDIFCGDRTFNITKANITDVNGTPIKVSISVIYSIINPNNIIQSFNSSKPDEKIISNLLEGIIRDEISCHSYNDLVDVFKRSQVMDRIINIINTSDKVITYGIEASTVSIIELNYSKEIAESMLKKQNALATLEARKIIVESTVDLVNDIGSKLKCLSPEDQSKLARSLTLALMGSAPTQVVNVDN